MSQYDDSSYYGANIEKKDLITKRMLKIIH